MNKTERSALKRREMLKVSVAKGIDKAKAHPVVLLSREIYGQIRLLKYNDLASLNCYGQLVRSSSSVGANVIEGFAKVDPADTLKFLKTARGSAYESVYWAELLGLENINEFRQLADMVDETITQLLDIFIENEDL